ncbi:hypothetical protein JCM10213v2_000550 [Rhodosporidiobolus nylandii]
MSTTPSASSSSIHRKPTTANSDPEDSDDLLGELEEELDNDFDLGGFREKRMMELKAQVEAAQRRQESGYGRYTEFKAEKDLISTTAKAKRSVVHFFHRDFRRCKIMDSHLEKLAAKHTDTLFVKADVANVPFLVTKLDVKVLPLVGFDELEGGDNFSTASLEVGMVHCGVLTKSPASASTGNNATPSTAGRSTGLGSRVRGRTGEGDSDFDD